MVCICVHNKHHGTAAILGAPATRPGDDRPPARAPVLETVALGSDSLAGQPASALDPRLDGDLPSFVTNDDAAAAAPTSSSSASTRRGRGVRASARRRRRRPLRRAPARRPGASTRVVRLDTGAGAALELRTPRAVAAGRAARRQPRLLRDRGRLALGPLAEAIDGAVVGRKVRCLGRRPRARARLPRGLGAGEPAPYSVGGHRHAPEIEQQLGSRSASSPTSSPCAAACS